MKTVRELQTEFAAVKDRHILRSEKLPIVQTIRGAISEIERAAASDFSFPLDEIQKTKAFLMEIDNYLRK